MILSVLMVTQVTIALIYSLTGKDSGDIFSQFLVKLKTLKFVVGNLSSLSAIAAAMAMKI